MANKNKIGLDSIKVLALDMMEIANSGHPGIVLSASPIIYSLFLNHLNVNPENPSWINRDRFVLSCGHASALLYATLHYFGYDYSLDDLKRFRDIDSFTPGHPELNINLGIETTTGPLGQGISNAVGMALAERYYETICRRVDKKCNLIDYYTYVLCSDGDLQEGISYEALSFAGMQKLNKLILLYDCNNIQLDGEVKSCSCENIIDRFEAINFNVIDIKKGNNIDEISSAIEDAKTSKKPSLIICHTKLGQDSIYENTNKCHGKPLGREEVNRLKELYKLPSEEFTYNEEIRKYIVDNFKKRVLKKYNSWLNTYNASLDSKNKDLNNIIDLLNTKTIKLNFDSNNYKINEKYCDEGRNSNNKVMNFIAPKSKFFLGGSADVASSTKAQIEKSGVMSPDSPLDRNIAFGVREHAMAGIANGMALSDLRVFTSAFLAFSNYMMPSIRMASMMHLPVSYIFTHDSIYVGEDGSTHEPIEQINQLRLIPNLKVFRPADINEIIGYWEYYLASTETCALILSRTKNKILKHTSGKYVKYGAYIVKKEKEKMDAIIIATGQEVEKAIDIACELEKENYDIRVVSMPCMELFLEQNPVYEEKLLPKDVLTFTLEAGSTMLWNRFATNKDCTLGLDTYGASGKPEDVAKFMEFDINSLIIQIKKELSKH